MKRHFSKIERDKISDYFSTNKMFVNDDGLLDCNFITCNDCIFGDYRNGKECIVLGSLVGQKSVINEIKGFIPEYFL